MHVRHAPLMNMREPPSLSPLDLPPRLLRDEATYGRAAQAMIDQQLARRDIRDPRVLAAMRCVPRHLFLALDERRGAYEDCALPTMHGQTISQPYMVAIMTQQLAPQPTDRVLEIGTGSGYQTMILALLCEQVVSIERDGQLVVWGADTLAGTQVEVKADLVVLATGLIARDDAVDVARMLGIPYDEYRLFTEGHPKLAPVETVTSGIFLTGACQSPKDIPDTVATASAASAKTLGLFSREVLVSDPVVASVDPSLCSGCLACVEVCPFSAIEETEWRDPATRQSRTVAHVIESLCHGCGNCTVVCRAGAPDLAGFSQEQILSEVLVL